MYKDQKGNIVELVGTYDQVDVNGYYKVFVVQYQNGEKVGVADVPFRKKYQRVFA